MQRRHLFAIAAATLGIFGSGHTVFAQQPDRPVLILPGIAGTHLYDPSVSEDDKRVWLNLNKLIPSHSDDFLTESLYLSATSGQSIRTIETGDILRIEVLKDIFQGLVNELESEGYEESATSGARLFVFPYDWRLNLEDTTTLLQERIGEIKSLTGATNVDIVAHSMGGLLAKNYISASGTSDVGKLVFVGTPHLGAPKAAKTLLMGDDLGINILGFSLLNHDRVKEIAENSPAIYQLLPSEAYFDEATGYLREYQQYPPPPPVMLDWEETEDYLFNEQGLNSIVYGQALEFFDKHLEDLDLTGMEAYNIVGADIQSPSSYVINPATNEFILFLTGYAPGDGTVPLMSADSVNVPSGHKYYYLGDADHSELPSAEGVKEAIVAILLGESIPTSSVFVNEATSTQVTGKVLWWHGPSSVHVYGDDGEGNFTVHTGPASEGFDADVPGVAYEVVGNQTRIFLPMDAQQEYEVSATGTASGTFDLRVAHIENGVISTTYVFNDAPITPSTEYAIALDDESVDDALGYSGDLGTGIWNAIVPALFGDLAYDFTPPVVTASATGTLLGGSYASAVDVTISATDPGAGVHRIYYSTDGGGIFDVLTGSGTLRLVTNGTTTIDYYAVDRAGNNSATSSISVHILRPRVVEAVGTASCAYGDTCRNGDTFTLPVTTAGEDRRLVVDVYQQSANCSGAVTAAYDGAAMTQVASVSFSGAHWKQFELASPTSGTRNLVVTKPSGACDFEILAAALANVDPADPHGTRATALGGSGGSMSVNVTGAPGGLIHSAFASPNDKDVSPNAPLQTLIDAADPLPGLMAAVTSATGSVTTSWTVATQGCCVYWALVSTPFKRVPVETVITSGPPALTASGSAVLHFTSPEEGATYTCAVDGGAPFSCWGSVSLSGLAVGSHTFSVYATDIGGYDDPTPAAWTWNITDQVTLEVVAVCTQGDDCFDDPVATLELAVSEADGYLLVNTYRTSPYCSGDIVATYAGATMTRIVSIGTDTQWEQFELIDPATGTNDLVVTRPSGSCDTAVVAALFKGVDLGDPYDALGTASGGSGSETKSASVTGAEGGLVYSVLISPNAPTIAPVAPLSLLAAGTSHPTTAGAAATSEHGSLTTSWTIANQGCCAYWAIISTPLNPAGGGSLWGGGGEESMMTVSGNSTPTVRDMGRYIFPVSPSPEHEPNSSATASEEAATPKERPYTSSTNTRAIPNRP